MIDYRQPGTARQLTADAGGADRDTGARARSLVWMAGVGAFLVWVVLVVAAYMLWSVSADWLIVQTTALGRATGLPLFLAVPLASFLYLIRNFGGPALTGLGIVVSVVILSVTALAARLVGGARG